MKIIKVIISLIVLTYLTGASFIFVYQDNLLYQPTEDDSSGYSVIEFSNEGQRLNAIVLNPGESNAILYFGGSGESMGASATEFAGAFPEHTTYLINYRGYGGSTGKPGEQEFYSDALKIYDELSVKHTDISVIGYSLGSGIAIYLASKRPLQSISLAAPYDSMVSVAKEQYPFYPSSILLKDRYDSAGRVGHVSERTLIIFAEEDMVIPYKLTLRLINTFPSEQVKVKMIRHVDHNSLMLTDEFYIIIKEFIDSP